MPTRSPIILLHGTTREEVPATFVEDVAVDDLKNADREWQADLQPYLEQLSGLTRRSGEDWRTFSRRAYRSALALQVAPERLPEHPHWEWAGKQRRMGAEKGRRFSGALTWAGKVELACMRFPALRTSTATPENVVCLI